ncbi:ATP-binding cassette domain-containing protein [Sphingobacterium faecale]|uniref:ATP-binding cassette domain-containing protein n=1 Tax=Sphingobacterium faecale TaxID=2803775 RepID=A0ABS1R5J5_9SPHI|nr:ATP-binding cassette domain-containing protein [Sphingobacterium faecale]MBL1409829.1 ATP-binding cassette domain-containing protein [Sphingobacterium faecale]
MSIEVRELTKSYNQQKALDAISFTTGSNHIIGFLGPNGAGKSTTMKILTGIIPIEQGSCSINGLDIQENPLSTKRSIGYLPESNPLYSDMYVQEILHFEARLHNLPNSTQRVQEVIAMTGLQAEQHKRIAQLSKGFKQRVGLALAIIHDPEVLILDEPTTGLDPNQIIEIRTLIQQLSTNKTVFLSTHIMQEVEVLCQEIIIIHKGQIKDHFLSVDREDKYPGLHMEDIFVKLTNP